MRLPTTNALPAIKELLQTLGQAFDQKKLRQDLLSHPEYPSLLALNEVLQQYGIDNDAVEVEKDKLNELPTPFIAYMKLPPNGKDFALVHKVFNGSVSLVDANAKAQTVSRDSFLNDWQQIALVVDRQRPIAASVSDAPSFWDNKKHLSLVSGVCVSALLLAVGFYELFSLSLLVLNGIGIAVTILLLMLEINKDTPAAKQFCAATQTVNCNAVLQSKGARFVGLSWSEMGFAYFVGNFLFQLFALGNASALAAHQCLALLALPYVVYSIYYQQKVVRQWCLLCLAVQAVLFLQGGLAVYQLSQNGWRFQPSIFLLLMPALLLLPLLAWRWLKPQFSLADVSDAYKFAYLRLQNNPSVFTSMLSKELVLEEGYADCGLQFGNPNAQHTVIKVCNPFCRPCAQIQPLLEEIQETCDVCMYLIFAAGDNESDKRNQVARHFVQLYQQDMTRAAAAIHWWYALEKKDTTSLLQQYPVDDGEIVFAKQKMAAMQVWNEKAEITHTPTIYVDGFRLHDGYSDTGLKHYLKR
jgi:uncharacterized membrane protein